MNTSQATLEQNGVAGSTAHPCRIASKTWEFPRAMVADLFLRYLWLHGDRHPGGPAREVDALVSHPGNHVSPVPATATAGSEGHAGQRLLVHPDIRGAGLATARNEVCQYAGPAPVSIQQYHQVVKAQAAHVKLSRESLRRAFRDLVLPDEPCWTSLGRR
jgi:hypothetical protein